MRVWIRPTRLARDHIRYRPSRTPRPCASKGITICIKILRRPPVLWITKSRRCRYDHCSKTIDIDRREPFLIRSIVYFSLDGHPVVTARLSEYDSVEGSSILVPRRIDIKWIERDSSVRLEFLTMKRFDNQAANKLFRSPRQRGEEDLGRETRIDQPPPPTVPAVLVPATQPQVTIER